MTQEATEKPVDSISATASLPAAPDAKNSQAPTAAGSPSENSERETERPAHLFKPGQSGNPAGKPKGARNKATRMLEELLDGEAEALTRKAIELAKAGDLAALRLCLDRLLPPRKDRPVSVTLPAIESAADATAATAALLNAVTDGQITPAEASEIGKLIEGHLKAIEATEILARIERLEKGQRA